MRDRLVFSTTSEAYLYTLKEVLEYPQYVCAPRGLPIHEVTDYSFTVTNPDSSPIVTRDKERNGVIAKYTAQEMDLYNSCSNRIEDFAKASKFWEKIANPDGTINSAYGYLIWKNRSVGNHVYESNVNEKFLITDKHSAYRTPWEWAKQSLISDKDTRQAILRFSLPEHQWVPNKDFVCTMHANFLIRNNKLNLSVVMRSNDLVKGLVYDISWFCSLINKMYEELKPTYPDLQTGSYTHFVHSIHAYEKDFPTIKKMLGNEV